jgi:hypothetical protein
MIGRTASRFLALWAFLVCGALQAATQPKPLRPSPPAADINAGALDIAVRASLAAASEHLLIGVASNFLHMAAPPKSTRKHIGWDSTETYELRYREETIEIPRYAPIYEEYETFQVGGSHSVAARKIGKVTAKRVVGRKQVGTVEKKRLRQDPDGAIVRTHTRGIGAQYGPGSEIWANNVPGDNALALLALLKSGVPETDERLQKLARALDDCVQSYGISDLTWNAAWVAAAFANLKDSRFIKSRDLAISRVLDGQIASGAARGMWGPLCINLQLLPILVQHENDMNAALATLKAELPKKMAKTRNLKRRAELEAEVEHFESNVKSMETLYRSVTQQGMRFQQVRTPFALKSASWDAGSRVTAGLPYDFYNQTLADLESTALALFAIGEAAANGCLPAETQVPTLPSTRGTHHGSSGGTVLRPQSTSGILARAAAAIAARQERDGGWNQCNVHQASTAFTALGLPALNPEDTPPPLTSVRTRATIAQGYASLLNAGKAVGISRLMGKYGRNLHAAYAQSIREAEAHLNRASDDLVPSGRIFAPYDLYFAMLGIQRSVDPLVEQRRDLWMRFAHEIIEHQDASGAWEKAPARGWHIAQERAHTSSLWAWKPFETKRVYALRAGNTDKPPLSDDAIQKIILQSHGFMGASKHYHHNSHIEKSNREVVATSLAMLFLADGVSPPIGGFIATPDKQSPPELLGASAALLRQRDFIDAPLRRLTAENIAADITGLPLVQLSGARALSDDSVKRAVQGYLKQKGVLIVAVANATELAAAGPALQALIPGSAVQALPATAPFMANYKGAKPRLKALIDEDDRILAILVPASMQYTQAVYLFIRDALGAERLDPRYPSLYFGDSPFVARIQALAALRAKPAPLTAVAPDKAPSIGETDTPSPASPTAPAIPDDEKW